MINAIYKTKEVTPGEDPQLHGMVERLSRKIGIKMPRVMVANIPIPNAFAYGSPLAGNRVAVTKGMLRELEDEEVEAVIGHELGHLKHRDVQVMMFASVLPAIFYFLGYSLMLSAWFGGGRQREGGGGAIIIGMASMAIYFILNLFVLGLSRLREYYADFESAVNVDDGPRKLSEALAKIVASTGKMKGRRHKQVSGLNSFKTLFIEDPDRAEKDELELSGMRGFKTDQMLVKDILSRKVSTVDRVLELFSTHPNMVKRLKALQKIR